MSDDVITGPSSFGSAAAKAAERDAKIAASEAQLDRLDHASHESERDQYAIDIGAYVDAVEEHGFGKVARLETPRHVPGLPTLVVVLAPVAMFMKRFRSMVKSKPKQMSEHLAQLADTVIVYPDAETYAKMREQWTAFHDSVGLKAIEMSQAKDDAEGKG